MRLLGYREEGGAPLPPADEGRDPGPGLRVENPSGYERLISRLTSRDPSLAVWTEPLARGKAVVVLTGQQPGLLGGPLYTLYKTLTAVAVARRLRARSIPAIAGFWAVGDDTDFDEVSPASWPVPGGPPRRVHKAAPEAGERIGSMPGSLMDGAYEALRADWPGATVLKYATPDRAATWSDYLERTLRLACHGEPILFVDGNDPEVIRLAQPWLRGFVGLREDLSSRIDRVAAAERGAGTEPAIGGEEALRALFTVEGKSRRVVDRGASPGSSDLLLPNVVLRPALQEHCLPVHAVVCGEGEIAYRRLLGPIYEAAGRPAAPLMRRFEATLFPPSWSRFPDTSDPAALIERTDDVLNEWGRRMVDPEIARRLAELKDRVGDALHGLEDPLSRIDRSLPQFLASAAGKIDYQLRRIQEVVLSKGRTTLYRGAPELAHIREYLLPRGKPQERSFVLWTPFLYEGIDAARGIGRVVDEWLDRGGAGHAMIAMEEEKG